MNPDSAQSTTSPLIQWSENGQIQSADWRSESGAVPPRRVIVADDTINADIAYRLACEGTALLWRGDFQNARQLLQALARRVDRPSRAAAKADKKNHGQELSTVIAMPDAFHRHRLFQSQRARTLGMLLLPFNRDHRLPLRRAPDVSQACREASGEAPRPYVSSLRELLGIIGAHEWRKKGVEVKDLAGPETFRIYPHYGVFAPVRTDYVPLVARAPLPKALTAESLAFDIGSGTGVLSVVLAKRGVSRVLATENNPRALQCAVENLQRLGLQACVDVIDTDLFPVGRAALIVCNPPWVPGRPSSALERAVFDPDSRMLRGFLAGLAMHLVPGGEGWLILSDLAEHLRLRSRDQLLHWIREAGLQVLDKMDATPTHPKAADPKDPLHHARAAEVVSLWRLGVTA